jgi:hypothetical protein
MEQKELSPIALHERLFTRLRLSTNKKAWIKFKCIEFAMPGSFMLKANHY